jgi:hypothetical protein
VSSKESHRNEAGQEPLFTEKVKNLLAALIPGSVREHEVGEAEDVLCSQLQAAKPRPPQFQLAVESEHYHPPRTGMTKIGV